MSTNKETSRNARRIGLQLANDVERDVRRAVAQLEELACACDAEQATQIRDACDQALRDVRSLGIRGA